MSTPKRRRIGPSPPPIPDLSVSPEAALELQAIARRALNEPFSHLPPDVIVSEILPHICLPELPNRNRERFYRRHLGRFVRDRTRNLWMTFRNVTIGRELSNVLYCRQQHALTSLEVSKLINKNLPMVLRKYIVHLNIGENRNHLMQIAYDLRGRPDRYSGRIRTVLTKLFESGMPNLVSIGGVLWRMLVMLNIPHQLEFNTINFCGKLNPHGSMLFPAVPNKHVERIVGIRYEEYRHFTGLERIFQAFPKLETLRYADFVIGTGELGALPMTRLFDIKNHMRVLHFPKQGVRLGPGVHRWTTKITRRLCITAGPLTVAPHIHENLRELVLRGFNIPQNYETPYKVVFDNCIFTHQITTHERTVIAIFKKVTGFRMGKGFESRNYEIIGSVTLEALHWSCTDLQDTFKITAPRLKHVFFKSQSYAHQITINSNERLDMFTYSGPASYNLRTEIVMPNGTKTLKLVTGYPYLPKAIGRTVEKLVLENPPPLSILRSRRGYRFTQLKEVHIEKPKPGDTKGAFKLAFPNAHITVVH